jgi:hypothetical protein
VIDGIVRRLARRGRYNPRTALNERISEVKTFPGVNPFIEASGRWTGFHNLLIARCSELLNETLPPNYAAFVVDRLEVVEPLPAGDFYAFISRGNYRPRCDVYGWSIRRQVPNLPIPLKAPDADALLDLGQAFSATFDRNRYDRTARYDVPLRGTLGESDAAWLDEQLALDERCRSCADAPA